MSHDTFHGGYARFAILREVLCRAAGWPADGDRDSFPTSSGSRVNWEALADSPLIGDEWVETVPEDPLIALAAHSDCQGRLPVLVLRPLADRIEELLPQVADVTAQYFPAWMERRSQWDENVPDMAAKMVMGLRRAAASGEEVTFG